MNKAQLVEELSIRFEGNRKQAQHALESVIDVIQRTLVKGEKVAITGFGSFEKIERAARTARNPATGASVRVKKTSVPKFRPGAELKAVVSGAKKLPKAAAGATGAARAAATRKSVAGAGPAQTAGGAATAGATRKGAAAAKKTSGAAAKRATKASTAGAATSRSAAARAAGATKKASTRRAAKTS